jgi:hypothetical protein
MRPISILHVRPELVASDVLCCRFGRLDWRAVADVKLEDVIARVDVKSLQCVVDPLTFSDVRPEDLPLYAPELVCKCVKLLQLVVEYLLNYQYSQQDLVKGVRASPIVGPIGPV